MRPGRTLVLVQPFKWAEPRPPTHEEAREWKAGRREWDNPYRPFILYGGMEIIPAQPITDDMREFIGLLEYKPPPPIRMPFQVDPRLIGRPGEPLLNGKAEHEQMMMELYGRRGRPVKPQDAFPVEAWEHKPLEPKPEGDRQE